LVVVVVAVIESVNQFWGQEDAVWNASNPFESDMQVAVQR
jgi:hypothetical protein